MPIVKVVHVDALTRSSTKFSELEVGDLFRSDAGGKDVFEDVFEDVFKKVSETTYKSVLGPMIYTQLPNCPVIPLEGELRVWDKNK